MAELTDRYGVQRKTPSKKTKTYERPGLSEEEIEVRLSPCCCVTYSLLTRVVSRQEIREVWIRALHRHQPGAGQNI